MKPQQLFRLIVHGVYCSEFYTLQVSSALLFPPLLLRSSSDVGVLFNNKKSMPVTTICWVSSKYYGDTYTYINRGGNTLFSLASLVP